MTSGLPFISHPRPVTRALKPSSRNLPELIGSLEPSQGHVRWLRPAFQNPQQLLQKQELLAHDQKAPEADLADENAAPAVVAAKPTQQPWPAALPDQVRAVAEVLVHSSAPLSLLAIEARFKGRGPWKKGLPMLLQTLEVLGRAAA